MKRVFACTAAVLAAASVSQPARAQYSGSQTGHVQCIVHYGDRGEVTDITPVTKITIPQASGSAGKDIQFTLSAAFQQYLLQQGKKFYKSACLENDDPATVQKRVKSWEASKGYGNRDKNELDPDDFWPPFLDYVHSRSARAYPDLPRAAFSYSVD
jgi:hypothetical protein